MQNPAAHYAIVVTDKLQDQATMETVSSTIINLEATLKKYENDYEEFLSEGKKQTSTFHFWHQYISDVQVALDYILAEKFQVGIYI